MLVREETAEYKQNRRHLYKMIEPPSPTKDYFGEVFLTLSAAGGIDIRWSGWFIEKNSWNGSSDAGSARADGSVLRGSFGKGGRARVRQRAVMFILGFKNFRFVSLGWLGKWRCC